jgi:hypothetical protein
LQNAKQWLVQFHYLHLKFQNQIKKPESEKKKKRMNEIRGRSLKQSEERKKERRKRRRKEEEPVITATFP